MPKDGNVGGRTQKKKPIIIVLGNATRRGFISGGETRLVETLKRLNSDFTLKVIGVFSQSKYNNIFKISKFNQLTYYGSEKLGIAISYATRTVISCFKVLRYCLPRKEKIIIYASSDFFPDTIPALIVRRFNHNSCWLQCIFHVYSDWRSRPGLKIVNFVAKLAQDISFTMIKNSDGVICINSETRRELVKKGIDRHFITIIPPGIDMALVKRFPKTIINYDCIFIGRLNPSKGIFEIPNIWRKVVDKYPNSKLAIVGKGNPANTRSLEINIKKQHLNNNISLLGYVSQKKMYGLLKSSKVFIFPSHEEGFGIVIAEAMACGTPVVCWDLPVYKKLFEDHILKSKENDIKAFSNEIIKLLSNRNIRNQISKKAKKYVQKYSWNNAAKKESDFINMISHK